VRPGERTLVVKLRSAASLRGRVTRAGEPVRGFTLGIDPVGEEWLAQGKGPWEFPGERFDLHDVLAEPLRVMVKTADGSRGEALVTPRPGATAEVEIVLRGTASVHGRLVNAATHAPVSDALVFLENDSSPAHQQETLADGRFFLQGLSPGEHVLILIDSDTQTHLRRPLRLSEGDVLDLGEISVGESPQHPP
jgi:hypothetical protein